MEEVDPVINLRETTLRNNAFRNVIQTEKMSQLVVMSLMKNENIGYEIHEDIDQFIYIEKGQGWAKVGEIMYVLTPGVSIFIPRGTYHDIINGNTSDMKLFTIYSPPHHEEYTYQQFKPISD